MVFKLLCLEPPNTPEELAPISLNDLNELKRTLNLFLLLIFQSIFANIL